MCACVCVHLSTWTHARTSWHACGCLRIATGPGSLSLPNVNCGDGVQVIREPNRCLHAHGYKHGQCPRTTPLKEVTPRFSNCQLSVVPQEGVGFLSPFSSCAHLAQVTKAAGRSQVWKSCHGQMPAFHSVLFCPLHPSCAMLPKPWNKWWRWFI